MLKRRARRKVAHSPQEAFVLSGSVPAIQPKVGLAVTVYSTGTDGWQRAVGAGWRFLVVIAVGRKWITLFQVSGLTTVKWTQKDWDTYKPRTYEANFPLLRSILSRNVDTARTHSLQFSEGCAKAAMGVLKREPSHAA